MKDYTNILRSDMMEKSKKELIEEFTENYEKLPPEYQQFVDVFVEYLCFKQKNEEENLEAYKQLSKGFNPSEDECLR